MSIGTPTTVGSHGNSGASTTCVIPISSAIVAGNLVVVAVGTTSNGDTVSGVSDGTNTYVQAIGNDSTHEDFEVWYCANAQAVASGNITVTFSASAQNAAGCAAQVSGMVTSSSYDSAGAAVASSGTTPSVTTGTLATSNEIVFGALFYFTSNTYTEASGFTNLFDDVAAPSAAISMGYEIVSSTTAVTYAPSLSTSRQWSAIAAPFKGASAAVAVDSPGMQIFRTRLRRR